jgi:hypothetical protein
MAKRRYPQRGLTGQVRIGYVMQSLRSYGRRSRSPSCPLASPRGEEVLVSIYPRRLGIVVTDTPRARRPS